MSQADPKKLKKVKEIGRPEIVFGMARMPKKDELFFGGSDFKLYRTDIGTEKPDVKQLEGDGHKSYVTSMAFAKDAIVSGGYDCRLVWWNPKDGKQVRAIEAHDKWIRKVVASPDGKLIVSVGDDMLCKVWDAANGKLIRTIKEHKALTPNHYPSMLFAVTISADGQFMATGDKVGHVVVSELATGKKVAELETPGMYTWDPRQRRHSIGGIRSLAFSQDSRLLAVGGMGKVGNIDHLEGAARVEIFDWQSKTKKQLHLLEDSKKKGLTENLHFAPDATWLLATGGNHNGFLTFYDMKTGKQLHQDAAPMHVHTSAFNEDCTKLYAVGHSKVAMWTMS